jgi:hypothetical protein
MLMTRNQAALTGAIALNIPTIYWATQLPAGMVVLAAAALAVVGAALGALAAFGFTEPRGEATRLQSRNTRDLERRAA